MTLLLVFFSIAIVTSFLCSLWEAVLLSVTPAYAQARMEQGSATGRQLQGFKENIDRPLAAILTLNTIAHTVGAIGVGSQANKIWAEANPIMTTLVVPVVMTLGILILSEIIPKTIGANSWQRLAPFTVQCLRVLIALLAPLVWMSQSVTKFLKRDKDAPVLTRSDFLAMTQLGEQEGVIETAESDIIGNLLKFSSVRVSDIMTPRTVVVTAPEEQTVADFLAEHPDLRFTRIPIFSDGIKDHIQGFVLKTDLLTDMVNNKGQTHLKEIGRNLMVVPGTVYVPDLFRRFLDDRQHLALVVDEFGGMSGIVSMEDVIETLLGMEIVDELDHAEDMQSLARALWQRRAKALGLLDGADVKRDTNHEEPDERD
ncbi:MAG: hemolysin family protein [Xanthomonadales bacterium]|nr:hemolysin family protein [Xanthomonadales bacterium]